MQANTKVTTNGSFKALRSSQWNAFSSMLGRKSEMPSNQDHMMQGMSGRKCTDVICAIIYIIFLGGMIWVSVYASVNGKPRRLLHGMDWNGTSCGLDPSAKDKPFLYYCGEGPAVSVGVPTSLNLQAPICLTSCPTSSSQMVQCLSPTSWTGTQSAVGQTITFRTALKPAPTYASRPVLGLYCIPDLAKIAYMAQTHGVPTPGGLRSSLLNGTGPIGDFSHAAVRAVGSMRRCWLLLVGLVIFAGLASFAFLQLLRWFPKPIVYTSFALLIIMFFCIAFFFLAELVLPRPLPFAVSTYQVPNASTTVGAPLLGASSGAFSGNTLGVHYKVKKIKPTLTLLSTSPTTTASFAVPRRQLNDRLNRHQEAISGQGKWQLSDTMLREIYGEDDDDAGGVERNSRRLEPAGLNKQRWFNYKTRKAWERANPYYNEKMTVGDAKNLSLATGGISFILGCIFLCLVFCARSSIDMACKCVETAVECLDSEPGMLVLPVVELSAKLLTFLIWVIFFLHLVACGRIQAAGLASVQGAKIGGMSKEVKYTDHQKYMIGFYVFGLFWLLEMATATGLFVVSFATVKWYRQPHPKTMQCFRGIAWGYIYASTFHLGTLAFGSFLLATVRFVKLIFNIIMASAKLQGGPLAPVAKCILCCTDCLISCIEQCISYINKITYVEVVLTGENFCRAAKNAVGIMAGEATDVMVTSGACIILSAICVLTISLSTGMLAYWLVTWHARWTSNTSPHHVSSPRFIAVVAALLAAIIAHSFMTVFDQICDSLLYVLEWSKTYMPKTVAGCVPNVLKNVRGFVPEPVEQVAEQSSGFFSFFSGGSSDSVAETTKLLEKPGSSW